MPPSIVDLLAPLPGFLAFGKVVLLMKQFFIDETMINWRQT